jgi:phosphoglycolate phosphatase-like HAD superfamily hydrolase
MRAILFDIDGTLINTRGAGGSALREAFRQTFDIDELADVAFSGRTDRGIINSLLKSHGIDGTTDDWRQLCERYLAALPGCLQQRQGRVLDGVVAILEELASRDTGVGLLTGNLRAGARLKLDHFGLYDHFAFGGFGDDHEDRDDVARAALAAAREANGNRECEDVWVVGDTPLDIRCARAINARVLAVATGIHPIDELADLEPDLILTDLSEKAKIIETLFS